jgi:glycolate oxidase FAD binding subunit
MDLIHPHTKAEVADALRDASAGGNQVLLVGGRTHADRAPERDAPPDIELWTTQLDELVAYDPAEMLAVAGAGMRIRDLTAALAEGGQEWAVDAPPGATVGGVIAAAASSPRRLRVGMVRDTVAELELVTGDGRLIRSGARTVKNVTGYDIHRLATGSFGTLGAIVQVALKLRPLPKVRRTLVTREGGLDLAERLLGAVPLPAAVIAAPDHVEIVLEGWPEEVEEQTAAARTLTTAFDVREDAPVTRTDEPWPDSPIVAEVAVPPSKIGSVVARAPGRYRALMGVGLVWLPFEDTEDLATLRFHVAELGGIAPVVRGPGGPGPAPAAGAGSGAGADITRRLRESFDPAGILG